jgi:hypothetical protein
VPRYTLVGQDGESLGTVELGRPDWPVGSIIYRGGQPNLRVVGRVDSDYPVQGLTHPPVTASRVVQSHAPGLRPRQTPVARRPGALVIRAVRGDCWLLVRRGVDTGPVLYEATLPEGKSVRFATPRVWVRFGAPWNVAAERSGRPVRTLPKGTAQPVNLIL